MENKELAFKEARIIVVDAKSMETASTLRADAKRYLKALTEEKEKVTKPINEALKAERARFKPMEDKVNAFLDYIDEQMSAYQTRVLKETRLEQEKIANRIGEGKGKLKVETAMAKLADVVVPDSTVGNTRFTTDYEVVVTDIKQIPDQYLKVEIRTLLLKTDLKAGKKIPGVLLKEVQRPVYVG